MSRAARYLSVFLVLTAPSLFAAPRTWTGTNSGSWSDSANWGGTLPVPGDDLVFPAGASNLTNSNDFPAGTLFQSISFAAPYTVGGNALTIGAGGITSTGGVATITLPLQLGAAQSWTSAAAAFQFGMSVVGSVDLNGFALTLMATKTISRIDGAISGTGQITIAGNGVWRFFGANTYAGQTVVAGRLNVMAANVLGISDNTIANGTIVQSGGMVAIDETTLAVEYVRLFGILLAESGLPSTFTGTVELAGPDAYLSSEIATLRVSGVVTGTGRFEVGGTSIELTNSGNDFTSPVVLGSTDLLWGADHVLPPGKAIDVYGGLVLQGHAQTIASLARGGSVRLGGGGHLTISGPGSTTYPGSIIQSGTVTLTGGALTLTANNTFTGLLENNGGTLRITGIGKIVAPLTQSSGVFSLAGNGTAGAVTITGGTFAPGLQGTGIGNTKNLSVTGPATYDERIDGTTAGSFGNIRVTGTVELTGPALTLSGTASGVALGNQFVMIENDGADPIAGTFAGLPEGATISGGPGNFNYVISYIGGTGNDIVLTAATAPTATTVASSQNPSTSGQNVTFTATVSPLAGSGTPTGTVTFRDGSAILATVALVAGSATFTTSALSVGTHSITAESNGDATYLPSTSAPLPQDVLAAAAAIPALDPLHLTALALLVGAIAVVALRR
jgi:fibronectin-binding autotransporter adhesin